MWTSTNARANVAQARMLERSIMAAKTFARTLLEVPPATLYRLGFPVWSSWFYSTVLVTRHMLQNSGNLATSQIKSLPHAVGDLLPRHANELLSVETSDISALPTHTVDSHTVTTNEEAELIAISKAFLEKIKAPAADDIAVKFASSGKSFLAKVATLQGALLSSVHKSTARQETLLTSPNSPMSSAQNEGAGFAIYDATSGTRVHNNFQQHREHQSQPISGSTPNVELSSYTSLDNATPVWYDAMQQDPLEGWIWDLVMDDSSNIFTFGAG
jgi:hypothetical protein